MADRIHKNLDLLDLRREPVRGQARRLRSFLRGLFWRGQPVAVNGVPHRRFYVRGPKLWEYACGLAHARGEEAAEVLDFGGAASLPSFYLAARGARVRVHDLDQRLLEIARRAARRFGWRLEVSAVDLTRAPLPPDCRFDLVTSFCVIEHMSQARQREALRRLADALRPGGRLALSFELGGEAPGEGALRDASAVEALVEHLGLGWVGAPGFHDDGQRFRLDPRHPDLRFGFGLVVLEKR